MKPTDNRAELLEEVLEMLLQDRTAALSAGNLNVAVAAATKIADLLALRLQRPPEDEEPDNLTTDDLDPRQLARAIVAVLGSAVTDTTSEDDEPTIPGALHHFTAQQYEPADETDALDLSEPGTDPAVGERILCGDAGAWVEKTPDGRWRSLHGDGTLHRYHASRDEAEKQAGALRW